MNTDRKTAIIVGILFIIGTAAGVASALVTAPILDAPDKLVKVAANGNQLILGALFVLLMGFALALVPVLMFPILKKQNEVFALGYVVFRGGLETVTYMAFAMIWLLLVVFCREYSQASDTFYFQSLGNLLLQADKPIGHILKIVFPLGALMFNFVLYQSKIIPRWLSVWGLAAVTLHFAEGLLTLFGLLRADAETLMALPIFLQEMVFAVWLIAKGFNPSALAAGATDISVQPVFQD